MIARPHPRARLTSVAGLAMGLLLLPPLIAASNPARGCSSRAQPRLMLARAQASAPAGVTTGLMRGQTQRYGYTPAMDNYYRRALERMAPRVVFPAWLRQQVARGELSGASVGAASTGVMDYLRWRRDLNPARFDRYHPDLASRLTQTVLPPAVIPDRPIVPIPEIPLPQIPINPPQVPEPSTLLILTGLFAGAWWARWSRRWARAPGDVLG